MILVSIFFQLAFTHVMTQEEPSSHLDKDNVKAVISDLAVLESLGIPTIAEDRSLEVGVAYINQQQEQKISEVYHSQGKCGGFEFLSDVSGSAEEKNASALSIAQAQAALEDLKNAEAKNKINEVLKSHVSITYDQNVADAMAKVNEQNLEADVRWLSENYFSRYHRSPTANDHVYAMKQKLETMLSASGRPYQIDLIKHRSTPQHTVRLRLPGKRHANEVVVLGGHLDSILMFGRSGRAPGADDNASGAANLLEAVRILLQQPQLERSLEFFWYGGEEGGLLGSAEIAKDYRAKGIDVIAVLQLDMTLNPGSGEMVIGSAVDFTSAWLRDFLKELNRNYLNLSIQNFKCRYGCSDHASWFRQGFSTLMPAESHFDQMNERLHTPNDIIYSGSSFKHSALFSKIAIGFAMHLGNDELRGL